jgi:pyruvate dehydrogenase E2 component (dihydrolipoamide acetyltransferase)
MAQIIGLPKLSPTMEEGVLAKWHKKEGDKVSPGDIIAEVETDKANMDFPLEDEGTLLKLLVKEGDTVKLGAPVAILGESGEDTAELEKQAAEGKVDGSAGATGAEASKEAPAQKEPAIAEGETGKPDDQPATGNGQQATGDRSMPERGERPAGGILASPIAKTLAAEHGIDLRGVKGSGPGGRIVERDVRARMEAPPAPAARSFLPTGPEPVPQAMQAPPRRAPAPPPLVAEGEEFTDKSLSMMRKTIAKRLTESKQTVPHFYLTSDCDAGPLMAFRAGLNKLVEEDEKISVNDLIVKAAAIALRRVPAANASFLGDRIRYHGRVHVGVAVAIEDGLLTPVVFDCDRKGIRQISAEIRDLAGRAKNKKVTPEEMTGGTFTVSNLGMYGIDHFEAVINPPEGALLAVGAVKKVPVVEDDRIEIGQRMALTLSCDHRVVDGALGARLLQALVVVLENPAALAL